MAAGRDRIKYSGDAPANDPAWRVVIALRPSRLASGWVMAVLAAGLVALLWAQAPAALKAGGVAVLAAAAVRALRRHACREGPGAVRRFSVDLAGGVEVEFASDPPQRGRLLDGSFVAPWLVIVRWLPEGARVARRLPVPADAADGGAFRRLRILLRWR